MCGAESSLVQVIVSPTLTFTGSGPKANPLMATFVAAAGSGSGVAVSVAAGVAVAVAVGVAVAALAGAAPGSSSDPPQAASASTGTRARTVMSRFMPRKTPPAGIYSAGGENRSC